MTKIKDLESPAMRDDMSDEASSSLGEWYLELREKGIEELDDDDLCRTCRQGLFPEIMVPIALERLKDDPMAGDIYDGEMLVSLVGVPVEYWATHLDSRRAAREILAAIKSEMHDDMRSEVLRLEQSIAEE